MSDEKNPSMTLQTTDTEILARATRGEINLNVIASEELANRGLDQRGNWVGFDKARELHETRHITGHDTMIEDIARRELGLATLEARKSDDLDFHDLAVWQVKAALEAAYEAGRQAAASTGGEA